MLHRVAHVKTDVAEERITSIIRVTRIGELGTLAVTSNRRTLQRNTKTYIVSLVYYIYYISRLCISSYFFAACVGC
jgi:hypothetical protein